MATQDVRTAVDVFLDVAHSASLDVKAADDLSHEPEVDLHQDAYRTVQFSYEVS